MWSANLLNYLSDACDEPIIMGRSDPMYIILL